MERIIWLCLMIVSYSEMTKIQISQFEVYYEATTANKAQAKSICSERGSYLPDTIGEEEDKAVDRIMRSMDIRNLWLAISYTTNNEWKWFGRDFHKYRGKDILRQLPGLDCVVLRHGEYIAKNCFTIGDGFICEYTDCSHCSKSACFIAGGSCASIVNGSVTWYTGIAECANTGGQLSGFNTMMFKELLNIDKEYWVGLFRNGWLASSRENSSPIITDDKWQNDVDMKKGESCAIITTSMAVGGSDKSFAWKPVKYKTQREGKDETSYSNINTSNTISTLKERTNGSVGLFNRFNVKMVIIIN